MAAGAGAVGGCCSNCGTILSNGCLGRPSPASAALGSWRFRGPLERELAERRSCRVAASMEDTVRVEVTQRIKDLGRAGLVKSAMRELAAMADSGVQPDTRAATALLDACVRNGKMPMAETVFEDLFGENVEPDDITYCVMIRGFGDSTPPDWVAIKGALIGMEEDFGLQPTARVFNTILEVCAKSNDLVMAESFVERMIARGVQPDEHTFRVVQNKRAMRGLVRRLQMHWDSE